jgi:hypothetical protein
MLGFNSQQFAVELLRRQLRLYRANSIQVAGLIGRTTRGIGFPESRHRHQLHTGRLP